MLLTSLRSTGIIFIYLFSNKLISCSYNEIHLTETGRDPETAVFCRPASEPIGGNLLRNVWTDGDEMWSMPVCL
jgi:hypothetical protein